MVDPEPHPQERFGRHYWFKCKNKNCPAGPVGSEWEDFSVAKQRTQRCSKCKSPGMITRVQKVIEHSDVIFDFFPSIVKLNYLQTVFVTLSAETTSTMAVVPSPEARPGQWWRY